MKRLIRLLISLALPIYLSNGANYFCLGQDQTKAQNPESPINYARELESHPKSFTEVKKSLDAANKQAVSAGTQVEYTLSGYEWKNSPSMNTHIYGANVAGAQGLKLVAFNFAFEGDFLSGTGGYRNVVRYFGFRNPARLIPGAEGAEGKGSWAYIFNNADSVLTDPVKMLVEMGLEKSKTGRMPTVQELFKKRQEVAAPILAIVWDTTGHLPPSEVYVGGNPIMHFVKRNPSDAAEEVVKPNITIVNTNVANIRSGPSPNSSIIIKANRGDTLNVVSEANGWLFVKYKDKKGYISEKLVKK